MKQTVDVKSHLRPLQLLLLIGLVVLLVNPGNVAADTAWTQTTQADFESGTLVQLDTYSSPGDVKLAKVGSGYLYAFRGNNTKTFWRYDIAADNWSALADAPQNVGAGGALAFDGGNYIYALGGGSTRYFWRYDISAGTWSSLASTQYSVNAGGALVYTGNYLYAFRGGTKTNFWRYSISTGTWSSVNSAPDTVQGGGALTYDGGNFIYAFRGMSTGFWKYSISGNTWTSLAGAPSSVGDGGSLAFDGVGYIYALKGANTVTFWRYQISADSWVAMADTPATPCVYGGGALAYDKESHFYALRGNNQDDFWKYDVSGNNWAVMYDTPAIVAYGGALVFKGAPYYTSGTLASSSYDTGGASNFGTLAWTATVPAGTLVKFQIATNNDNVTWVFKGPDGTSGTYYTSTGTAIWSGHDGDRYIKYKAFFSATDTTLTPVLSDVSVTYVQQILSPTATTSNATLVEETTATLNGAVAGDGGEGCQYRFEYGTVSGGPYPDNTGWTGNVTTGQSFNSAVSSLGKGTKYYFRAQVKNSTGIGSGGELEFLTKPDEPVASTFVASSVSDTEITLTWTKGEGAQKTMVRRNTGDFPVDRNDGVEVYFDTGTGFTDTGLTPETTYYYRAWSYASGSEQWSDSYQDLIVTTASVPVPPVAVGGTVYPVNKALVLAPWLAGFLGLLLVVGGVVIKLFAIRKRV